MKQPEGHEIDTKCRDKSRGQGDTLMGLGQRVTAVKGFKSHPVRQSVRTRACPRLNAAGEREPEVERDSTTQVVTAMLTNRDYLNLQSFFSKRPDKPNS